MANDVVFHFCGNIQYNEQEYQLLIGNVPTQSAQAQPPGRLREIATVFERVLSAENLKAFTADQGAALTTERYKEVTAVITRIFGQVTQQPLAKLESPGAKFAPREESKRSPKPSAGTTPPTAEELSAAAIDEGVDPPTEAENTSLLNAPRLLADPTATPAAPVKKPPLQGRVSKAIDIIFDAIQEKIESTEWIGRDKPQELWKTFALAPLQTADTAGMKAAWVVNNSIGVLLTAAIGPLGRLISNIIALAARVFAFATIAVAGYALELFAIALYIVGNIAYTALAAGACILLGAIDASITFVLGLLILLSTILLVDPIFNKTTVLKLAEKILQTHTFFNRLIKEVPLILSSFGEEGNEPKAEGPLVRENGDEEQPTDL